MTEVVYKILSLARRDVMRLIRPGNSYFLARRSLTPLSSKFGFDRGTPIDRYWIEKFLSKNKRYIKGNVLEITDNKYTRIFGGRKVLRNDVLDINRKNKKANIYGDLRDLKGTIKDDTYNCVILTHVLGLIDDLDKAISECHRILKKGGVVLVTSSCFSPTYDTQSNYWRFTVTSMRYLFEKKFLRTKIKTQSFGNVLAGQCFWVGMAKEELTQKELDYNDPRYPCIVTLVAIKS